MRIFKLEAHYGEASKNRLTVCKERSIEGAVACIETFYYAFNNKDLVTFRELWFDNDLVQVNNPLGGMLYGTEAIIHVYKKIFSSKARVWVDFHSIVAFEGQDVITFAGREQGQFSQDNDIVALEIRTTRILTYSGSKSQWCLMHHHGSIDDPALLSRYQQAVR